MTVCVDLIQKHLSVRKSRQLISLAFAVYLLGNLYFTLFSRVVGSGTHMDLRPFGSYLRLFEPTYVDFENATGFAALFLKDASSLTSILLNILLYYPLGYLLSVLFPRLKTWQILLIGMSASIATETVQYLLAMGWFETDDILHNTLGTFLGLWGRRIQCRRTQRK